MLNISAFWDRRCAPNFDFTTQLRCHRRRRQFNIPIEDHQLQRHMLGVAKVIGLLKNLTRPCRLRLVHSESDLHRLPLRARNVRIYWYVRVSSYLLTPLSHSS